MTSSLQRIKRASRTLISWCIRFWRNPERRRALVSVSAVLITAVVLVPASWLRHGVRLIIGPGWWWLPILLLVGGLAGLGQATVRWWRRSSTTRQRPEAVRAPLFLHVAVLLLIAVAVAAAVAAGMWALFGQPRLAVPGITPAPGTSPGGAGVWSVQNTFDAMKIVLSVVAGIGGVVALTVAYRKQGHSEAAEHREDTKLFNDRFGKASDQLGSDKAAVRLAGAYAMAGLADDWAEGRQTCIDVLCAYLRMPYTPSPPDPPASGGTSVAVETPGLPLNRPEDNGDDDRDARQERQVRHTVLVLIGQHLQPAGADGRPRWHGHRFDLRGAVLDGGNLRGIDVTTDTVLDFTGAAFPSGRFDFTGATFSGGEVDFIGTTFSGGEVDFFGTTFSGGTVAFADAAFSDGTVNFPAAFSGGTVIFSSAMFSGGTVTFAGATFSGGTVYFTGATFSGGTVNFTGATFSDGTVNFIGATFSRGTVTFFGATFSGGTVTFFGAAFSDGTVTFTRAAFSGSTVNFTSAALTGSTVNFSRAVFTGGAVNFTSAAFSGSTVTFTGAAFTGSTVDFIGATFSGGTVDISRPRAWTVPPVGVDRSEQGVQWPSAKHLTKIGSKPS